MTEAKEKVALLVNILHEQGYKGRPFERDGVDFVESGSSGYKFLFSFASEGTVQLYCGIMKPDGFSVPLSSANDFNKEFRFAKIYVDDDGDLVAQADFFFDPAAENAAQMVEQMTGLMDVAVGQIKKILAESIPDAPASKTSPGS